MGAQTFNRYNLFYRLERHLLLHKRGAVTKKEDDAAAAPGSEAEKFGALVLPPLPSRYRDLDIPRLWFLSSKGSDKKRSHRKSHGVASFTEIARIVAGNWKAIDHETMNFVTLVSDALKAYTKDHGIVSICSNSNKPRPKKIKEKESSPSKLPNRKVSPCNDDDGSLGKTDTKEHSGDAELSLIPKVDPLFQKDKFELTDDSFTPSLNTSFHGPFSVSESSSLDISGRSKTPLVSNRSSNDLTRMEGVVPSTIISAPVLPSPAFSSNIDLVSNVEQSFLQQVLGAGVLGGGGADQQQTISNLLAMMNSTGEGHVRQSRSASMPLGIASSMPPTDVELLQQRGQSQQAHQQQMQQAYRRASSYGSCRSVRSMMDPQGLHSSINSCHTVPSMDLELQPELQRRRLGHPQQRRASSCTLGSSASQELVKELDIHDEEIFQMWKRG